MSTKRFFYIVFSFLFPFTLYAQEPYQEGRTNQEGLMVGKHVWRSAEDGQILAEIVYDDQGKALSYKTWVDGEIMEAEEVPELPKGVFPAHVELEYTSSGLGYMKTRSVDAGSAPVAGQKVTVHYEGYLQDHSIFDSSYERGKPFRFTLGKSQVIPGFEEAVLMLKPGEEMYVYIGHQLGYGERAAGSIPPYSNLWYKIELVESK